MSLVTQRGRHLDAPFDDTKRPGHGRHASLTRSTSDPTIVRVVGAMPGLGATNRYQVLARLAVGGMAEIFLVRGATVAGVERYCVLKRVLPEHAGNEQFVQMFLDEARLATLLQHPNIAQVYDVGMLGDSYFYTMEYVHGETIRAVLERGHELGRPLPLACVLTIIAGIGAALHHAHERAANDGRPLGIVHRDISPSNLMVSYEGNLKLVDFGVAKATDCPVETRSGTVKGKISYLSPEQCHGERIDRRSDLFSLGIVMWEMLVGTRLYRRPSDFENMAAIIHEVPQRPSRLRPEVPPAIDEIVMRLLAKPAADRFQSAAEVVEAIENASMRAGTMLSTAAVRRLVQDLFGPRVEPWLALERNRPRGDSAALVSRPLPSQVAGALLASWTQGIANADESSAASAAVTSAYRRRTAGRRPGAMAIDGAGAVPAGSPPCLDQVPGKVPGQVLGQVPGQVPGAAEPVRRRDPPAPRAAAMTPPSPSPRRVLPPPFPRDAALCAPRPGVPTTPVSPRAAAPRAPRPGVTTTPARLGAALALRSRAVGLAVVAAVVAAAIGLAARPSPVLPGAARPTLTGAAATAVPPDAGAPATPELIEIEEPVRAPAASAPAASAAVAPPRSDAAPHHAARRDTASARRPARPRPASDAARSRQAPAPEPPSPRPVRSRDCAAHARARAWPAYN